MNRYRFVEAEKAQRRNVTKACELLEVSTSAFYDWRRHVPTARQVADEELGRRIQAIYDQSRGTYGWPRVHQALRRQGVHASRKWVARIMRQKGLAAVSAAVDEDDVLRSRGGGRRPAQAGVRSRHRRGRPGLRQRPHLPLDVGGLALPGHGVIDLSSRRVVGWAMADHMRTDLVSDALAMAVAARHPAPGLIFHSDRGAQYTSKEFTDLLAEHKMIQSLSRPRQCWDNAVAESFFSSLKLELIHTRAWATRAQVRRAVVEYIEVFYNRGRLHSSLGYLTPDEYETRIHHHKAAHAA